MTVLPPLRTKLGSAAAFGDHRVRTVRALLAITLVALTGCPNRLNVPCDDNSNCNLSSGGACLAGTSSDRWCAYPDSNCPSGFRYSELDVGDGLSGRCTNEGPVDAGVDAPAIPAFDVAFPSEWKFSVPGPVSGYLLVINRGGAPLNMSSLQLKSLDDDHPTANVRINVNSASTEIAPGSAGGQLSGVAQMVLIDSGLVTEPRTDTNSDYLSIEVVNAPAGTYDIHVDLKLGLDNLDVPLPMTLHMVPGPTIFADPVVGKRSTIYRQ